MKGGIIKRLFGRKQKLPGMFGEKGMNAWKVMS
jgi:hypothetical protein